MHGSGRAARWCTAERRWRRGVIRRRWRPARREHHRAGRRRGLRPGAVASGAAGGGQCRAGGVGQRGGVHDHLEASAAADQSVAREAVGRADVGDAGKLWGKPTSVEAESFREGDEVHGVSAGDGLGLQRPPHQAAELGAEGSAARAVTRGPAGGGDGAVRGIRHLLLVRLPELGARGGRADGPGGQRWCALGRRAVHVGG